MSNSTQKGPLSLKPLHPETSGIANTDSLWQKLADISLRKKLVLAFLVVALVPMGLLALLNNNAARGTLTEETKQILSVRASETATRIDTFIETNLVILSTESQMPDLIEFVTAAANDQTSSDTPSIARISRILDAFSNRDTAFIESYALLDRHGKNIIDTDKGGIGQNESDYSYFQQPIKSGTSYISDILFSKVDNAPYLYFSHVVNGPEGQSLGVLRVRYKAAILQHLIVQSSDFTAGRESFAILLDDNFVRLADAAAPELVYKSLVPLDAPTETSLKQVHRLPDVTSADLSTNLPSFQEGVINAGLEGDFVGIAHPNAEVEQGVLKTLSLQPTWTVVFVQAQSIFLTPVQAQSRFTILLALTMTALVVGFAVIISRILARPITRLTSVVKDITSGNLTTRATVESRDEIGQLAQAFNNMTVQLEDLINSLEEQVRERTAELTLSMQVGQRAASIKDVDTLLPTIVEFICLKFDFSNTRIFLVDDINKHLILDAGSRPNTTLLSDQPYSISIDDSTIVGQVVLNKQSVIVSGASLETSDGLIETQAQLAVPLIVENRVIGVLDLESRHAGAFTNDNLTVFEAMATQLAIAIDGARQWAAGQLARQRAEVLARQLTRSAWEETLSTTEKNLNFSYNLSTVSPTAETARNGVSVPLNVQSETIGHLAIDRVDDTELHEDDRAILSAVAQQLALKVENLRLFDQTQQRASREQVTRQISDKIRASRDIETALRTAAEALNKALNTSRAVVNLKVARPPTDKGSSNTDIRRQPHD